MKSRRKFIVDCSTIVASLAVAPVSAFSRPIVASPSFQSLDQMSHAMLAAQVNTVFRVQASSGQQVELKLLKAPLTPPTPLIAGRRPPGDAGNEKFSLIFSGPRDALVASAIHIFEHEHLGRFEMYVGQIGQPDAATVRYQTVFNRKSPAVPAQLFQT
jgi:hypothetical protein